MVFRKGGEVNEEECFPVLPWVFYPFWDMPCGSWSFSSTWEEGFRHGFPEYALHAQRRPTHFHPRLGETSGIVGIGIALALGAFAAEPLYAAFPVAEVLLRKGVSLRNVWIFLGAWSTMKIPMLLFEFQNLGGPFAVSRYVMSFFGVLSIAFLLDRFLSGEEKEAIRHSFLS